MDLFEKGRYAMSDEKKELTGKEMEEVSGGYVIYEKECPAGGPHNWKTIDTKKEGMGILILHQKCLGCGEERWEKTINY